MSSVPSDFLSPDTGLGGLPPVKTPRTDSAAIPAHVSDLMLINELRRQIYGDLTADPEKDPMAIRGRSLQKKGLDAAAVRSEKEMTAADALATFEENNKPPPPPMKDEAPKFADYAKKASPLLLILTQLAGGKMGVGANGMLGALKGQLDGVSQNNIDSYTRARQAWTDHWDTVKENWQNQDTVYKNTLKNYEGQIGAEGKAAEAAEAYSGVGDKMIGTAYDRYSAKSKLMANLSQLERAEQFAHGAASAKALTGVITQYQKSEQGLTRLDQAESAIKDNLDLMPKLLERYKNTTGKGDKIIIPEKFSKFMASMSDDPMLGQFTANILSLKSALVGIDMPVGTRGSLFLYKLFAGTAPDALSDSAAQIQTKLNNDFNMIEQAKGMAERNMRMWGDMAGRLGYNIPNANYSSIPRSEYPDQKDLSDQISAAKTWLADPKNAKDPQRAQVEAKIKELEIQ